MRIRSLFALALAALGCTSAAADEPDLLSIRVKAAPAFSSYDDRFHASARFGVDFDVKLTPRLSLRPLLGFGIRGGDLSVAHVGAMAFVQASRQRRWRPYGGAGLAYTYRTGAFTADSLPPPPADITGDTVTLRTAAGLERRLGRRWGLFAELGVAYTIGERYRFSGKDWYRPSGWQADLPFRQTIGVSFDLR